MKILFILEGNLDVRNWSGTTLSLYDVLSDYGMKVSPWKFTYPNIFEPLINGKEKYPIVPVT